MPKRFVPFICSNNSFGSIDYGMPIVANKATDFRTSTSMYHRLIPMAPQDFDCRVKARIKPSLKNTNVEIRDITNQSVYKDKFNWKFPKKDVNVHYPQCKRAENIEYLRTVQEKIFRSPPPVKPLQISEMKESYYRRYIQFSDREVYPPEPYATCEIRALGRDEQPAVRPEATGHWKLMDPYLTTTRATYVPFTVDQQNGVAKKDIVTFYGSSNFPKSKRSGSQNGPISASLVPSKAVPMLDKVPFKKHPTDRRLHDIAKIVPNLGKTSEMKASYVPQSFSNMSPYLFQNGIEFPESLSKSCAWQDLASPGMYCTDYCHVGTGWPVNSIIDYGLPPEYIKHLPCYSKFCDWSQ